MSIIDRIFNRKPKIEPIIPNYPLLWARCQMDNGKVLECNRIIEKHWTPNKKTYQAVELKTGVPAWIIFCIHYKEASCNFSGVLHNGDKIIGTGKKTYNVPKGRGAFNTWSESAIDALLLEKNKFPYGWGSIPTCLEFCEKYNGLGHRLHGEFSPYVWSYTNNSDETGNYTSDGKYSDRAVIKSAGVASLLLALVDIGEVRLTDDRQYYLGGR